MGRVQLLPEEVASQVAAGEVVERPASVVKELVENSLDAEARSIEIAIRNGGKSLIRVIDDGIGMDRDDALMSLERHATSKIRSGDDLAAIHTLGFRGEALPSIASVSRFRLSTRPRDALAGTEIRVTGGRIESVRDGGDAPGTQIEVRSLFFNLPARRKFLRTENTENSHIEQQLRLQALGHPGTKFVFIKNEKVNLQLPAVTHLRDRIGDLMGPQLVQNLLEVQPFESYGICIHGFIGKAGMSRSTRADENVFVNGRVIESPILGRGIREGYHTALMKGQHPVVYLFIRMDPAEVDVNVHPAKREARFRNGNAVREALAEAVRRTLDAARGSWSDTFRKPEQSPQNHGAPDLRLENPEDLQENLSLKPNEDPAGQVRQPREPRLPGAFEKSGERRGSAEPGSAKAKEKREEPSVARAIAAAAALDTESQESGPAPAPVHDRAAPPVQSASPAKDPKTASAEDFHIIGVLGRLYVLMENAAGLVLVDQHAAHERILFEQLRRRMEQQGVPSQKLLFPLNIEIGPRDGDWIEENLGVLQKMGIGIEPFGAHTFKIDTLPQFVKVDDPQAFLWNIIDDLRSSTQNTSRLRLGEEMIAKTVCRHAVKAHDTLKDRELQQLIRDLLDCDLPYCCPHGRPTMIQMSYSELEKKFGRIQA